MASHKPILLLLTAAAFILSVHGHLDGLQCDHNQDQEPSFIEIDEDLSSLEGRRILKSDDHPKMRIYANYDHLDTAPSSYKSYVENHLAPPVIDYFQGALKVKYPVVGRLRLSKDVDSLCGMKTPRILQTTGVIADYIILFNSRVEESNIVASSKYCFLASTTRRPLIATSNFNRHALKEANGDVLLHERNTYLLIHEMMHTFGFSNNLYQFFIDGNGHPLDGHIKSIDINGKRHTVIDVHPLTQKLREHYGCLSIPGAIMENDGRTGTANSHFERKFFLYETMTSGNLLGRRVSEFSLALLEGSGWYIPDYSYAEPFFFGQGQGCDFIYKQCDSRPQFSEYCSNGRGCSPHGRSGGFCQSDPRSDDCKYYYPIEENDCENSQGLAAYTRLPNLQTYGRDAGSKCFTGTLNTMTSNEESTSFCFKFICSEDEQGTQLHVNLGNEKLVCEKEGEIKVDGYYGHIDCPDPLTFCNTIGKQYCPRNCLGRGICINNQCQCNDGYYGIDCGLNMSW